MAAYQLRRCAQEAADAERASLLASVRPAALPAAAARPADCARDGDRGANGEGAQPTRGGAQPGAERAPPAGAATRGASRAHGAAVGCRDPVPSAPGAAAGERPQGGCAPTHEARGGKRRRPARACAGAPAARQGGHEGAAGEREGAKRQRRADACAGAPGATAAAEGAGREKGGDEGALCLREERALALLALAASDYAAAGPGTVTASGAAAAAAGSPGDREGASGARPAGHRGRARGAAASAAGAAGAAGSGGATDAPSMDQLGLDAPATRALAALDPAAVRRVLGALAARFPRSAAALLTGGLPPAAAELLTARLEAADAALAAAGAALRGRMQWWGTGVPRSPHQQPAGLKHNAPLARQRKVVLLLAPAVCATRALHGVRRGQHLLRGALWRAAGRGEEVAGLYARLWAAVDDPQQAMASLLQGKEALAAAALRRALRGALCLGDLGQGPG